MGGRGHKGNTKRARAPETQIEVGYTNEWWDRRGDGQKYWETYLVGLVGGVGEAIGINNLIRTKILEEHEENMDANELNTMVCVYVYMFACG